VATVARRPPPERDEAALADAIEERAGLAADRVPSAYLNAWARLNCQKPAGVSERQWRLALDDGGRFIDEWGVEAAEAGWTPGELFDAEAASFGAWPASASKLSARIALN
jgi:hypothetical protein